MGWNKRFGAITDMDICNHAIVSSAGGFLAVGERRVSAGLYDGLVIKTDDDGNILWKIQYGENALQERFNYVYEIPGGGYLLAGRREQKPWVVKIDATGAVLWSYTYGSATSTTGMLYCISKLSNGDFAAVGYSDGFGAGAGVYHTYLFRISPTGNLLWDKTFLLAAGVSLGCFVTEASNGDLLVAGKTSVPSGIFLRTDGNGALIWHYTYPEASLMGKVEPAPAGGYVLSSWGGLAKSDEDGNIQWAKTYTGINSNFFIRHSVGGYMLAGGTVSGRIITTDENGNCASCNEGNVTLTRTPSVLGLDASGGIRTSVTVPIVSIGALTTTSMAVNEVTVCASLPVDPIGSPVKISSFTGQVTEHNTVLLKWMTAVEENVDRFEIERKTQDSKWEKTGMQKSTGNSGQEKKYYWTDFEPFYGSSCYRLRTVDLDGAESFSPIVGITIAHGNVVIGELYPNPVQSGFSMEIYSPVEQSVLIRISDVAGKTALMQRFEVGEGTTEIRPDVQNLSNGIYVMKIRNGEKSAVRKFIVE